MIKACKICGTFFAAFASTKTCSISCSEANRDKTIKRWNRENRGRINAARRVGPPKIRPCLVCSKPFRPPSWRHGICSQGCREQREREKTASAKNRVYRKKWARDNPEKMRAYAAKFRRENREKINEYERLYRVRNIEKLRTQERERYRANMLLAKAARIHLKKQEFYYAE